MDNFKNLEQTIERDIDPNGPAGSILAANHQAILKTLLAMAGKYTGSVFTAQKNATTFPAGTFSWNGNAMNVTNDFTITLSKKSADLNDIGLILETMVLGDIIQFKDYNGRAVFLIYQSHASGVDGGGNPTWNVTVKGLAENPNYIYQDTETAIAVLSYHKKLVDATPAVSSDAGNTAVIGSDGKIYVPETTSVGTSSVENRFADIATMIGDQTNQTDKGIQYVGDASADPTVDSGFAYYEYLGTTNGTLADYRKLSEQESMDVTASSNTEISIRNANGTEQFKITNFIQFDNVVFDVANKRVTANGGVGGSQTLASKTGTSIVFTDDSLYNEKAFLTAGDLTLDLTGAVKGVVAIVYCDRYIPQILGENYLLSGVIATEKLNELWFFYNGTHIELNVVNKAYLPQQINTTIATQNNENTISKFNVFGATSYEILFSTTNDVATANPVPNYNGTDLGYVHTGLTAGVTYYYFLRAFGRGYLPSDQIMKSVVTSSAGFNTTGLLAYYKDDETTGTVSNDAHGTNDGTLNNITLGAVGLKGTAISLNGTTSFVSHATLNAIFANDFTVACWVKTTQTTVHRLWDNRGGGAFGAVKGFQMSPAFNGSYENTFFDLGTGTANAVNFPEVPYNENDGEWHLIGMSFKKSEGRVRLVIDTLINEKVKTAFVDANFNSLGLIFGKSNSNNQYFNGLADERFVFQKELTQGDWDQMFNQGNGTTI